MSKSESSWLTYMDAEYRENIHKWRYTREVFTGEYSDLDKVKSYLVKRAYWEKDDAYKLRIAGADPDMLFSLLIGSIVGQLFAVEGDEKRVWQRAGSQGLGDPNDPDTIIGRLWDNADGEGTAWPVLWRQFATRQMVYHQMYILVEGIDMRDTFDDEGNPTGEAVQVGEARVKLIDPEDVLSKGFEDGRLSWVKVKHRVVTGGDSPMSEQEEIDQYTVYTLDGWQRWQQETAGPVMIAEGTYEFYETNDQAARCLPIFRVRFPFPVYVAHYLARKAVVIFNQESARDTFLGEGTVTHLVETGDPMGFEAHKDDIMAGENHLNYSPGSKAEYIAPPDGPARLATDVLRDKRENLFLSAYQQYGQQAAETTATEIRQQARAGVEAFLTLFSTTLEEAQNRATWLLEQVYFPDRPELWGGAKVELSRNFVPMDQGAQDATLRDMLFGPAAVPVDAGTLAAAAARLVERQGFELTEDQTTALRAIYDAYVAKRDGLRPRLAETSERLSGLLASFNGAPVAGN